MKINYSVSRGLYSLKW